MSEDDQTNKGSKDLSSHVQFKLKVNTSYAIVAKSLPNDVLFKYEATKIMIKKLEGTYLWHQISLAQVR